MPGNKEATASAFAPGHITGFFEICDDSFNLLEKGSRGAGFCLSLGVVTRVKATVAGRSKKGAIHIRIGRSVSKAPVSRSAIEFLLSSPKCEKLPEITIETVSEIQLPVGQGFGMSGAGALSTTLSLSKCINTLFKLKGRSALSYDDAVTAAHCAEVLNKTGLGDVAGQANGGWEIRTKPGIRPYGKVIQPSIPYKGTVVLAVLGKSVSTKKVLSDNKTREEISSFGKICVDRFNKNPTLRTFFTISNAFSVHSGISSSAILNAMYDAGKYGLAAQSMLGNSVFAIGENPRINEILKHHGKTYCCTIGGKARLL